MRGKNGAAARPRGLSIGNESMCLFSDDPLMQGLALFGNGGLLLSHTPPNFTPGSYEVCVLCVLYLSIYVTVCLRCDRSKRLFFSSVFFCAIDKHYFAHNPPAGCFFSFGDLPVDRGTPPPTAPQLRLPPIRPIHVGGGVPLADRLVLVWDF